MARLKRASGADDGNDPFTFIAGRLAPFSNIALFLDPVRGAAKFVEGSVDIGDHVINVWLRPL